MMIIMIVRLGWWLVIGDDDGVFHQSGWSLSPNASETGKSHTRRSNLQHFQFVFYELAVENEVALVGGWLPNVCVSHAANSSLTGLLSSHLDLHCIILYFFSWISLSALYLSQLLPTHPTAWFIVCLSVTRSQFVENINSVHWIKRKKPTHSLLPLYGKGLIAFPCAFEMLHSISLAKMG